MSNELDRHVTAILATTLGVVGPLRSTCSLSQDLNVDSLETVNLLLAFERDFKIEIEDEEIQDVDTVQHWIDLIGRKVSNREQRVGI